MKQHDRRLTILVHKNPDADALASARLVKEWYILEKGFKRPNIAICGNVEFKETFKRYLRGEGLSLEVNPEWKEYEACIVDTQTPRFLEPKLREVLSKASRVTIYDHHINELGNWKPAVKDEATEIEFHVDQDAGSCCEYIWKLISKESRKQLDVATLNMCLLGINEDSFGFMWSTPETENIAKELLQAGASIRCVGRGSHNDVRTYGRLKFFSAIPANITWLKESKLALIRTSLTDYKARNHVIDESVTNNRTPMYLLSALRKDRMKYCETIHGYLLVYDKEWIGHARRYVVVLDLVKWSPKRQKALGDAGFHIYRKRQERFYFACPNKKYFELYNQIEKAMVDTMEDEELIDIYDQYDNF